ncbi:MAG: hypothetical protein IK123_03245 [Lachnospiraceae bacterium]|nr:hypothetical protein [Lachnospiraceae bacterium]
MSVRMKLLPALITLLAGAFTSIITYLLHYDVKKALFILLIVLILFYILGTVFQKVIFKFEKEVEQEEIERAEQEGKVVEKDVQPSDGAGTEQGAGNGETAYEEAAGPEDEGSVYEQNDMDEEQDG